MTLEKFELKMIKVQLSTENINNHCVHYEYKSRGEKSLTILAV